jgi:hypothetical protein
MDRPPVRSVGKSFFFHGRKLLRIDDLCVTPAGLKIVAALERGGDTRGNG